MKENNDISNLSLFIKSNLMGNNKTKHLKTEKYIILIEHLKDLLNIYDYEFRISNNIIRHIIICGDITDEWIYDIVIYLNCKNVYLPKCINKIQDDFILKNIDIIEKTDKSIKFMLNILNKEYIYVIKEQHEHTQYKYNFAINQLEYDLLNDNIVNNTIKDKIFKIPNKEILNLRNLDFFTNIEIKTTKYEAIINFLAGNPLIIFELIELLLIYPNYFIVIEIKNFFINLNQLLHRKHIFSKTLKKVLENDEDFIFYKNIIKFSYNLEEKGMISIYIKYILKNYELLIKSVINMDIDNELFNIFDIIYFREFSSLLVFQHLIYGKRKIFREKTKQKKLTNDLLEVFMEEQDNTKSDDNFIKEDETDFNMLDKKKFSSLKYLKEMGKEFPKFEGLLKMFLLPLKDEIYIKNFYNINMLLFTDLKDIQKHHNLKLAYIIKRFHYTDKDLLIKIINIFNSIIKSKEYNNVFLINDNFINIITSKKLNDYIYKKMSTIPKINENFKNNSDCIDIIDFQDTFILFIEFLYKNKPNYSEDEDNLLELFDTIFDASLCDMRSYRVFKNEKRRKKEKKLKKEKKQMKEIKKNKYKIVKNPLEEQNEIIVNENDENTTTESDSDSINEEIIKTPELDMLVKKILHEENNEEEFEDLGEDDDLLDTFLTD